MSLRTRSYEAGQHRSPVRLSAVRVVGDLDENPDVSYLEQPEFRGRLAEYRRGKLHFLEMHIEADVELEEGVQALVRSTGVGGIESDTTEEELDELITEDWRTLRAALKTMGVPTEQLPLEVDRAWIEWRT
jgi:hypothetical protein